MRPPRPIATDHRKGAMKAALELRDAIEGEFEPALPENRKRSTRIVAAGPKDLLRGLAEKAMRILEDQLDTGETREQIESAQVLIAAWSKLEDEPDKPPELTPEARKERLLASLRDPDPELAEMLERAGWGR